MNQSQVELGENFKYILETQAHLDQISPSELLEKWVRIGSAVSPQLTEREIALLSNNCNVLIHNKDS